MAETALLKPTYTVQYHPHQNLIDRCRAVKEADEGKPWSRINNGFWMSIVNRALTGDFSNIDPSTLQKVLDDIEKHYAEGRRIMRYRRQENNRQDVVNRKWFYYFKQAMPEAAVSLETSLPMGCTNEQLDEQAVTIKGAREWASAKYEEREAKFNNFVEKLLERRERVMRRKLELTEFGVNVDPDAHTVIEIGLPDRPDRPAATRLNDAIEAFNGWLHGSSEGTTLRMGLSSTPVGHRAHKRRKPRPVQTEQENPKKGSNGGGKKGRRG
jgi:hypothetical protein